MSEYLPVQLADFHNAGLALLGADARAPIGAQQFRGLPFLIGENPERCFVALGQEGRCESLRIPIGGPARSVVVAHRLLETKILDGAPLGEVVADYVFVYQDGQEVRVPIRDGYELRFVSGAWGEFAFGALSNRNDTLPPRYVGRFEYSGGRQTEVSGWAPPDYYLWAWLNPRPEQPLAALTIVPTGPRLLVAALTLGQADEHPFVRSGARPVKIVLTDPADAARAFDVAVEVDRGVATFPYPLPQQPVDAFLTDPFAGWGEALNEQSSPAYVKIAATPSARVTVTQAGAELATARWGQIEEQKVVATPRVRLELVDSGQNWVRTTVVDDETGRPVPCRIHFRSPDGIPYQPHGHHAHVNSNMETWHVDVGGDVRLGGISYAYIDGTCQGWLRAHHPLNASQRRPAQHSVPLSQGLCSWTCRSRTASASRPHSGTGCRCGSAREFGLGRRQRVLRPDHGTPWRDALD